MPLKTHQLQALLARRREQEHTRVERTAAVSRYYDHWGKVTSRFENWTTPEYYKQADAAVQQKKDQKEKDTLLQQRRDKMRKLFADEKQVLDIEQKEHGSRPKSHRVQASTETLRKVEENARERDNMRRKLDLEAKLYGKWRHGVDDENAIFESKSDHEVLAKLNWLDKQIEDQLEREKEEAAAQERQLRLQEEISRTEAAQKERELIREQEIKEIRGLQETHMLELRSRQLESDELKKAEQEVREHLQALDAEQTLLEESSAVTLQPSDLSQAYNLKKIKVYIRKRSDTFRDQIQLCISILKRVCCYAAKPQLLADIIAKYEAQVEAEKYTMSQIESWYESEAKYNLTRCEEMWQAQHLERYHQLQQLLKAEKAALGLQLDDNLDRQSELIDIRGAHLSAIENSNDKLKQLAHEEQCSPRTYEELDLIDSGPNQRGAATITPRRDLNSGPAAAGVATAAASSLPKLTNSFTNLNLDVWQDLPSARGGIDSPRLQSQRAMQVVSPDNAERPKFGRKRVAWT